MALKPNILLINCDDMGYGDLGCYGSPVNRSPHVDALAQNGVLFTDFYAPSPVCSPSRGALMTGCYPNRIGFSSFEGKAVLMPGQGIGISHGEYTLPQALKSAGYATMLVGKWHCGDQPEFLPTRYGYDRYYGLPYSNDMGRQRRTWAPVEQVDRDFPPLPLLEGEEVIQQQPDQRGLIERYVEQCVRFIRESAQAGKPFYLNLAPLQVHLPLYAPERFVAESQNGDFGACVAAVDWALAALEAELKQLGLHDNTLIVFTSDNGSRADHGASNGPLRGGQVLHLGGRPAGALHHELARCHAKGQGVRGALLPHRLFAHLRPSGGGRAAHRPHHRRGGPHRSAAARRGRGPGRVPLLSF